MNIYGNYLPSKKSVTRILLKSLLGVFAAGVLFSLFFIVLDVVIFGFADLEEASDILTEFLDSAELIFVGVILWTMFFASIPAMLGGLLLSAIIYRDFKLGIASKRRSIKTGILLAGFVGFMTSFLVIFTTFRPADWFSLSRYSIPVALIVSLIGYWGAAQVHKEIEIDLLHINEIREKVQ